MHEEQPELAFPHPVARTWSDDHDYFVECPVCGFTDDMDGFDSIGADEDCLFCNNCHTEIQQGP